MTVNWEMVGALAESAGAIGVIATLIYLTLQIRQNSKLIEDNRKAVTAQASRDVELFVANWHLEVGRDPEARAIVERIVAYRCDGTPDSMEWSGMRNVMLALILAVQSQFINRAAGVDHDLSSSTHLAILRSLIERSAAWRKLWEEEAASFVPGFRDAVMSIEMAPELSERTIPGSNDPTISRDDEP